MLFACSKDVPNVMVIVLARASTFIISVPVVLITVEPVWVVGYNNEGIIPPEDRRKRKFKVILSCIASSRPARAVREIQTQQKQSIIEGIAISEKEV